MIKNNSYRLGIDLGTNSLGFALVELKDNYPVKLIDMGVRIFSDSRTDKTKTPLSVQRRTARGMRRRRDRLVRRRQHLIKSFIEIGLMPEDKIERKNLELIDPYEVRAKGLNEKLTLYELGRALFHINQRRGFQSNRKHAKADDEGKINQAIGKLKEELENNNCATVGEYYYKRLQESEKPHQRKSVRIRTNVDNSDVKIQEGGTPYDFYTHREMLKYEYDQLLKTQSDYYPDLLDEKIVKELKDIIFYQRDLCPVQRGKCMILGEGHLRAYRALPSSQYFRMLKEINNLKIVDKLTRRNRNDLSEEQRQKAIASLSKYKDRKFDKLAKDIGLTESESFNLQSDVRDSIVGLHTAITLANKKCFGDLWPCSLDEQDDIVFELLKKSEEENEAWLKDNYPSLSDEQIDQIIRSTVSLEDGTLRYSTEAINKLILQLESKDEETGQYKDEYRAVISCGWQYATHYTGEIMVDQLPYYGKLLEHKTQPVKYGSEMEKEYGRIANPTVHVALNQLQKVMNDIIDRYGHPKEIALEFSRELKLTKKEKDKRNKMNRENKAANKRYDEAALEKGIKPTTDTRLRQKLWEEQECHCAYSGKKLSLSEVLSDKVEIDHILPFSRTFDDSNANKVITLKRFNQFKGNRAPYQAFYENSCPEIKWEELLLNVEKNMPHKRHRFEKDAMVKFEEERKNGDKGWLARQITDTSYMARVAREYLRYVVGDRQDTAYPAVDVYPGGITAKLRRGWGLNSLLPRASDGSEKNREDHRHHAIDALVVVCANRSLLQQISRASAKGEEVGEEWYKSLAENVPPYTEFNRASLQQMVDNIVISHKPDHGKPGQDGSTSGALHKETFYGQIEELPEGKSRFVVRIPVYNFNEKDIQKIRDKKIRSELLKVIRNKSAGERVEDVISRFFKGYNIRHIRVTEDKSTKSMKAIKDKNGKPYRYVATGSNHHIDIFCPIKDSKELKTKAGKWYAETISTFDANQKGFEPRWRKDHPTAKLIMRLHINDMVAYEEDGEREIRRVKKIDLSPARVFLTPHSIASEQGDKQSWAASPNKLHEKNARKISVTPSGKVFDPGRAPMPKSLRKKKDKVT